MRTDVMPVPKLLVRRIPLGDMGPIPARSTALTRAIPIVAAVGVVCLSRLPPRSPNEVQSSLLELRVSPNDGHSNRSPKLPVHDRIGASLPIGVDQRRDGEPVVASGRMASQDRDHLLEILVDLAEPAGNERNHLAADEAPRRRFKWPSNNALLSPSPTTSGAKCLSRIFKRRL